MKRLNFRVFNHDGNPLLMVHANKAARMIEQKQAVLAPDGRALLLVSVGLVAPDGLAGRTRTSRGGLLAAVGRSQQYTTANARGQVNGFKTIYPEDRTIFISALLDCMVA